MHDVTERQHYEEKLETSENRLRAIMDNAAESIIVIDKKGIITDFNRASKNLFGYRHDETIGNNINMLMPSPYREQHDGYLSNYLETGKTHMLNHPRELPALRKDGSTFPMEITVTEIGHLGLYCGIIRDLSEQKNLEKEVADICSLEQDRIGQDIHDSLGQQLTGLSLMTSSLKRELERESIPQSKKLDELISFLQHATEDAQMLSRGLAPMSIETLGLEDVVAILIDDIQKSTDINCDLEIQQPLNINDHRITIQIYRIIQEAVNNAVKHAEAKNIHVTLRNTDQFELSISDDGKGFKVSDNKFRKNLGLRIMRYRAGIVGCKLVVESETGKGTTVHCTRLYDSIL